MSPRDGTDRRGWAMAPQDTRERTCEYTGSPLFSVFHGLRVARAPDPESTTVTRTYEATVEWTSRRSLPDWLTAVAETCTPYDPDRFGERTSPGDGSDEDGDGNETTTRTAADDGRFLTAPVDATVRPSAGPDPALSEPYHYWNTPLGRLQRDDLYPGSVASLTVDLADGPDAAWTGESTAGPSAEHLPEDRERYARVGLEFVTRRRVRKRDGGSDASGPTGATAGEGNRSHAGPGTDREWQPVGNDDAPTTDSLSELVEATLAPALRDRSVAAAIEEVREQIAAVSTAFEWDGDDPYRIPRLAVEAATSPPG